MSTTMPPRGGPVGTMARSIRSQLSPRQSWLSSLQSQSSRPNSAATDAVIGDVSPHRSAPDSGADPVPIEGDESGFGVGVDRPRRHLRMADVVEAVQGDLVATLEDRLDQFRVQPHRGTFDEEGRSGAVALEDCEDLLGPDRARPVVEGERDLVRCNGGSHAALSRRAQASPGSSSAASRRELSRTSLR